jgi:glycosyltransferase involved in cell wall biosynthesis
MVKKILYWAPCLNKVGTYYSTINSAISIEKYSKGSFKPVIINVCGEWNESEDLLKQNNVEIIKFYKKNFFKYLPKNGFLRSRFSYLTIAILSIIPLIKFLNKNKNEILIIHLIITLPLLLKFIFNLKIKTILRISGFPKLNILRKNIWKSSNKILEYITCPTKDLLEQIKEAKIFNNQKVLFLPDAIININTMNRKINNINEVVGTKTILAAGRLTKQKNFLYLLQEFEKFLKIKKDYKLIILGEGEKKSEIQNYIKKNNISDHVYLKGYVKNIFSYMKNSDLFVLSSLWEDPGFVIIEAAFSNLFVISSNCPNGPKEILDNGRGGILFKSNEEGALLNSFIEFDKLSSDDRVYKKVILKKNISKYTIFKHFKTLETILKKINV